MSTIEIRKIGITKLCVDAIVNAANSSLQAGGGVCGAIFKEAGYNELQAACNKIGYCETGSAVITPAFKLKSKYIIHAVGPIWIDGKHKEPQLLYSCYRETMRLAVKNNCYSIAFPLISSGIYGYPKEAAWRKAIQACRDFILKAPNADIDIIFAVLDDQMLEMGGNILAEVAPNLRKIDSAKYEKQLEHCRRGYYLLSMIDDVPALKISCREYSAYGSNGHYVNGLFGTLTLFTEEAYKNDVVIQNYSKVIDDSKIPVENIAKPDRDFLSGLTCEQILACITWHFRRDHFDNGVLINDSVANGHLLRLYEAFIQKFEDKV